MPSLLALGVLTAASTGCASRYKLDAKAPTHAALAKLQVKVNRDELRELEVTVDHLAPPHRLGPQYKAYAVWIKVPGHGTTKVGLLDYNEKRRRGTLDATTPFRKFEVIISLETNPSTAAPSSDVIVSKIVGKA
ncbi:MAG: hypothetical protein ACE37F_04520 [Nannocystaceae bacterium]|nr:hypothetical protein [bacterium]